MQASKTISNNELKTKNNVLDKNKKVLLISVVLIGIFSVLFLTYGVNFKFIDYALSLRVPKLMAIFLTGFCIAVSSVIFQTIVNNNILTPSVLGLDSLYVLLQTTVVFMVGVDSILIRDKNLNFIVSVLGMIVLSFVLYKVLFEKNGNNIFFMLLVGMIFGTLFSSLSNFMQIMIDPNEFDALQSRINASFLTVNIDIIRISAVMIVISVIAMYKDFKYLDVMSLGKDQAINLGVDYDRLVKKLMIFIAILVSISTALVGPITFLGLLVVNLSRQLVTTYKHSYLILSAILISILTLIAGQFFVERIFSFTTTIATIINFVGGIYFIYLLLKESNND